MEKIKIKSCMLSLRKARILSIKFANRVVDKAEVSAQDTRFLVLY